MFGIKSLYIRSKLVSRMDEWMCSYIQIMECTLTFVLNKNRDQFKKFKFPLTLHESLSVIKKLYINVCNIKALTGKLMRLLSKCNITKKGHKKARPEDFRNMQANVKAEDFVKLLGNGLLLIKALQVQLAFAEELRDAEAYLKYLRLHVENEFDSDIPRFPPIQRAEVRLDFGNSRRSCKHNYCFCSALRNRSVVADYIKKHFSDFASYSAQQIDLHFSLGYTVHTVNDSQI